MFLWDSASSSLLGVASCNISERLSVACSCQEKELEKAGACGDWLLPHHCLIISSRQIPFVHRFPDEIVLKIQLGQLMFSSFASCQIPGFFPGEALMGVPLGSIGQPWV